LLKISKHVWNPDKFSIHEICTSGQLSVRMLQSWTNLRSCGWTRGQISVHILSKSCLPVQTHEWRIATLQTEICPGCSKQQTEKCPDGKLSVIEHALMPMNDKARIIYHRANQENGILIKTTMFTCALHCTWKINNILILACRMEVRSHSP